jgi:tetratricopeptide (TPR) repeat protein
MGLTDDLPDFDALWDFDRPDASEQAFRDLLPLADEQSATAYRLELLTQIARAQGLQRRSADAHRTLDQVEDALTDATPRARLRYLLERGRVLNSSGRPREATPLFLAAWELGQDQGEDALAIDAAHMLGIVEPGERQLAWNLRALDLAERSRDPRAQRWLGSLLNNIGWTYLDLSRYEEALDLFRRAVEWRNAEGEPRQIVAARWAVGRALRSLGRIEEALAAQRELSTLLEQLGERDGYVQEELAECLLALGRTTEARPYFAAAHAMLSTDAWLRQRV